MMLMLRGIVTFIAFLGVVFGLMLRTNLSVAITVMTRQCHRNLTINASAASASSDKSYDVTMGNDVMISEPSIMSDCDLDVEGEFDWTPKTQELLLSAFYLGYALPQFPLGYLADRFSGKWMIFAGTLGSAFFHLLGPISARTSVVFFFATQFMAGFFQGGLLPGMNCIVNNWSPVHEHTRTITTIVAGLAIGPVVGQALTGVVCKHLGWAVSFYMNAAFSLAWALLWAMSITEGPEQHPCISAREKDYIVRTRAPRSTTTLKLPLVAMVTSVPLFGLSAAAFATTGFAMTLFITNIPLYMKHILHYDIVFVGILSALPFICQWICSLIASCIADHIIRRHLLSTTLVRKLSLNIGAVLLAVFMLPICLRDDIGHVGLVLLLCGTFGAMGIVCSCLFVNPLDIAPSFGGSVTGLSNSIGIFGGFFGPVVAGLVIHDQSDSHGWKIVFYIAAGISLLGALIFQLLGSGKIQPWAQVPVDDHDYKEADSERYIAIIPKLSKESDEISEEDETEDCDKCKKGVELTTFITNFSEQTTNTREAVPMMDSGVRAFESSEV